MAEVADAFVTLIPSFRGGQAAIAKEFDGPASAAGKSSGTKLSGALSGVLKKSAAGIGIAVGGTLGTALFKGFQRLSAIDEAKAKLAGLGNSAGTVSKIMDNALASVKGTAFGLGDAATVAAGAVASGIKPGKELEKTLKLVADSATIGGTSLGEMGAIFNKVAASGKIQGDVIAQLGDRGIPILQLLGKQIGKTPAEVSKLASQGKIDFKTFAAAMQEGLGGAALKSGNTFKGAFANMNAALGRLGAGLLSGLFPIAKQVFGSITGFLDTLTAKVGPVADKIAAKLPGAFKELAAAFSGINFGSIATKLAPLIAAFQGFASDVGSAASKVGPALLTIAKGLAPIAKAAVVVAVVGLTTAFQVLGPVIDGLATAFAGITNFVANNQTGFKVFGAIIGTVLLPVLIQSTVAAIASAAATWSMNAAWLVYGVTVKATAIGTKILTAAQWLLNAALTANPIGLVVVALIALGAAFVILWKKSSTFRTIVTGAFNAVAGAAAAAFGWIKSHWPLLLAIITGPIGLAVLAVVRNWDRIKSGAQSAVSGVTGFFKALPGKVVSALGNLGGTLKNAGAELISGFIKGIESKFGDVKNKLGSLTGKLTSWKGPESLDKVILRGSGQLVIDGFIGGLESRYHDVQASLGGLTQSLAVPTGARFDSKAGAFGKTGLSQGAAGIKNDFTVYQQPGESTDDLAERLWLKQRSRG